MSASCPHTGTCPLDGSRARLVTAPAAHSTPSRPRRRQNSPTRPAVCAPATARLRPSASRRPRHHSAGAPSDGSHCHGETADVERSRAGAHTAVETRAYPSSCATPANVSLPVAKPLKRDGVLRRRSARVCGPAPTRAGLSQKRWRAQGVGGRPYSVCSSRPITGRVLRTSPTRCAGPAVPPAVVFGLGSSADREHGMLIACW